MKINVLLVDGRKVVREGLGMLLEQQAGFKVIGESEDAVAAPKLVKALAADVVVLNVALATKKVADSIREISHARSRCKVVVLSMHPSPAFIKEILEAGAAACLSRECASAELVTAIRTVVKGETYLCPRTADALVMGLIAPGSRASNRPQLSSRELETLRGIADGRTTKEIALSLRVSCKTVETHRRRIMEKLNRHSVAELTKYAVSEGLSQLEPQGEAGR